jgi:hypothetical protein
MTLERGRTGAGWKQTPPEHTPRLRLKPKAPTTGYVDGPGGRAAMTFRLSYRTCWRCCRCDLARLIV